MNEQLVHSIVRQVVDKNDNEKDSVINHPLKKDRNIVYADGNITCSSGISNDLPRYNDPQKQREM